MQKRVSADTSALEILLGRLCDPIGVYQESSDDPCPPGEYDTYAGWIIAHLYEGGDRSSILADMAQARVNMGLANSSRDDEAADAILDWWQKRATS